MNVFITGESGTGKELIARTIHFNSQKKNEPFITINCAGITDEIFEKEIFGSILNSESDNMNISKQRNKFIEAGNGILFIDEICDLPNSIQSKLLRILEDKKLKNSANDYISFNTRIIAATNKNIFDEIKKKNFRQDLFYKLNFAVLEIPPLRDRLEDIPQLVDYFIKKINKKFQKKITGISNDVLKIFNDYQWPGNIRELENLLSNIALQIDNNQKIETEHIPKHLFPVELKHEVIDDFLDNFLKNQQKDNNIFTNLVAALEEKIIDKIGKKMNFNKTKMAAFLGISRVTINKKLKEKK